MRGRLGPAAIVLLTGCGVDPAPADLDGLVHWIWVNYDASDDAAAADAVAKLDRAVAPDVLESDTGGTTRLKAEEISGIALTGAHDPSRARGLYAVTHMACTLEQLEPLLYRLDQDKLHEGSYDTYQRTYTSSVDDYAARRASTVGWHSEMTASPMGNRYSEAVDGGLRRVASEGIVSSPAGAVLLARTYMPAPAVMESADNAFPQDYQIEAFWQKGARDVVHLFAVWREMKMGSLDTEGDALASLQLGGFQDWDEATEEHCK